MAANMFPDPALLAGLSLTELDQRVAELTRQAQAYVSDLHRTRRAAIRNAVDGAGATGRRRERVEAVAAELGISRTQVYQAMRVAAEDAELPKTLMEVLADTGIG